MALLLLDTHVLLWAAENSKRLTRKDRSLLEDADNTLAFSVASIWEVVIKSGLGRDDFAVEPRRLRRGLLDSGYSELSVISEHVLAVHDLPPLHKDPFDRLLVAQALSEGATLLTADPVVARYPGKVMLVG